VPDAIIATKSLGKAFLGKPALRDVSLEVERGSVYAFLGPNGAGKTTTIRLLLGLMRRDAGSIALFGLAMPQRRGDILARTGSLVESPSLYPHLTARENLEIPRRILGAPKTDIDRVLSIAGLQNAGGKLVRAFSLGMKQRLGVAQAMLGRRELLMLDEPTNGLDPAGITEMRALIRRLPGDEGITVFLSSHLLGEVEQVATHVGILSQGALVFQGATAAMSALRRSRLRIRVRDVEQAAAVLRSRGWHVDASGGALVSEDCAAAGAMNRALVEAGHDVDHLAVETASLEDVFLGMTNAEVR
jgi:ABC-2 type transport system ATP-binding protein